MATAEKTDPKLWETVKKEITDSDRGGEPGRWSARKAQMAVQEYKKRGGGYADEGPGQDETHLHQWTEEEWGTRSGGESGETGERYLPKKVRMLLTDEEYARSTAKKRRDTKGRGRQFSDQPDDVREKVSKIRNDGPTKEMLLERAAELDVDGRSSMTKHELLDAIEQATGSDGRAKGSQADLHDMSKEELYERAQEADIDGRSQMSKDELVDALKRT